MHLFSANLIQRCAGTHWWEIECPDCKAWIKTTLPTQILSNLDAPGYFNTLSNHRQGKKCLKGHSLADSSPLPSTVSPALSISSHFTLSDTSHVIDTCPGVLIHWLVPGPSFLETFPVGQASAGQGVLPFDIDTRGNIPCAYSHNCAGTTGTPMSPCSGCAEVVGFIEHLLLLAQDIKSHTKY